MTSQMNPQNRLVQKCSECQNFISQSALKFGRTECKKCRSYVIRRMWKCSFRYTDDTKCTGNENTCDPNYHVHCSSCDGTVMCELCHMCPQCDGTCY